MNQLFFTVWKCPECDTHFGIEEGVASCYIYSTSCPRCDGAEELVYKDNIGIMQFKNWDGRVW